MKSIGACFVSKKRSVCLCVCRCVWPCVSSTKCWVHFHPTLSNNRAQILPRFGPPFLGSRFGDTFVHLISCDACTCFRWTSDDNGLITSSTCTSESLAAVIDLATRYLILSFKNSIWSLLRLETDQLNLQSSSATFVAASEPFWKNYVQANSIATYSNVNKLRIRVPTRFITGPVLEESTSCRSISKWQSCSAESEWRWL